MIDFTLKIDQGLVKDFSDKVLIIDPDENKQNKQARIELIFPKNTQYSKISAKNNLMFVVGDLILPGPDTEDLLEADIPLKIRELKGFFYIISITKEAIKIFSSIFNILPVYYYQADRSMVVSSKIHLIKNYLKKEFSINKRFILEQRLFNYSFFNETIFSEIKLVPANSYIEYRGKKLDLLKHTQIEDYFTLNPVPWKESIDEMADLFLDTTKNYFPKADFYISFTGGFDGRALVACAKDFKQNFKTFSFGANDNTDLTIPMEQSKKLGLDFLPILLDDEYIENEFLSRGRALVLNTDCEMNFLHVHFSHSAKILAKNAGFVVNGMFGSELMRAMHMSGQVTSEALVGFFINKEQGEWIKNIRSSFSLNYLNKEIFKNEIDELIEDLKEYKSKFDGSLSKNHQFYKFIFEEAFRKFFGLQIISQLPYIKVRSPFLDFSFIAQFLQTELAGANNEFFTHNPLKRYKGQLFYAKIMQKTRSDLLFMTNDKCYKPIDLLTPLGILNIAFGYFSKRIKRKLAPEVMDNLRIVSGMNSNKEFFNSLDINSNIFNVRYIKEIFRNIGWLKNIRERDKLVEILSLIYYLNIVK